MHIFAAVKIVLKHIAYMEKQMQTEVLQLACYLSIQLL